MRPSLQQGSAGPAVRAFQHRLNRALRLPPIKEDGVFGRATESRTKVFQSTFGLKTDGIAGPATQATLAASYVPDDAPARKAAVLAAWSKTLGAS